MQNIKKIQEKAIATYKVGDASQKIWLEEVFGIELFRSVRKPETWEDILAFHKLDADKWAPDLSCLPASIRYNTLGLIRLELMYAALNNNRIPNPEEDDLYIPYFEIIADDTNPSGFGFLFDGWAHAGAGEHIGSRLCVFNSDDAIYAGKQFTEIFEHAFLVPVKALED